VTEVFQSAIVNLESPLGAIDVGEEELVAGSLWISLTPVHFFELARERTPFFSRDVGALLQCNVLYSG
jgi:hypothetical protein